MFCLSPKYRFIKPVSPGDGFKMDYNNRFWYNKDTGEIVPFTKYAFDTIKYPCGKCSVCLKNKRKDWIKRLYCETFTCRQSFFITLTYDDEHIPIFENNLCFNKKHCQNHLKLMRYYLNAKFKYFLISEYGSNTARPHYHYILFITHADKIFNLDDILTACESSWKFGQVSVGFNAGGSITYVTKYMLKYDYLFNNIDIGVDTDGTDYFLKPFALISKRPFIGSDYLDFRQPYIVKDGIKLSLPLLLKRKLGLPINDVHLLENPSDERFTPSDYDKLLNDYIDRFKNSPDLFTFHDYLSRLCTDIDNKLTSSFLKLDKV